jgi:hypothetical protein
VLTQQVWIKAENRKPPQMGEAIAPAAVQVSSSDTGFEASSLINGHGLRDLDFDDLTEHRGDPAYVWRSAKGDAKSWVEFDFGKPQNLNALTIWNYNDTWHTDQGVRKMDISVWTQETGWRKIRENQQVDQAEGGDGYDEPTIIHLDPTIAQKVRFDNLVSLGDSEYVGLSEVQFFGPTSSAASLVSQR